MRPLHFAIRICHKASLNGFEEDQLPKAMTGGSKTHQSDGSGSLWCIRFLLGSSVMTVKQGPIRVNNLFKSMIIAAAVLATVSAHAEPDQTTQTIFKNLMSATVSNNYDGFIAECDAVMKAAL